MTGVSQIGQANIAQMLQRMRGQQGGGQGPQGASFQPPQEMQQQFQSAAKELGIDSSKFAKLDGQIRDTVQQTVKDNQGASSEDLQKIVGEKVDGVLKDNGVDPAEFKKNMEKMQSSMEAKFGGKIPGGQGFSGFGGSAKLGGQDANSIQELLKNLGVDSSQLPAGSLFDQAA